jgi:hypothetical protein
MLCDIEVEPTLLDITCQLHVRFAARLAKKQPDRFRPQPPGTLAERPGDLIGHPTTYGLNFMLVAVSATLLMDLWESKAGARPICAAALVAFHLMPVLSGGWIIVAGALAAALIGALLFRPLAAKERPT